MGQIRKIGNDYYVEFYGNGLLFQKKAGGDLLVAEEMLKSIESQMTNTQVGKETTHIAISDFFENYLQYSLRISTRITFDRFQSTVQHFKKYLKEHYPRLERLYEVTPKVIESYRVFLIKSQGKYRCHVTERIINLTLFLLKNTFDVAIAKGHLNDNPCQHVKFLAVKEGLSVRYLTDEQIHSIRLVADKKFFEIFEVLLATGLRIGELEQVSVSMIDLAKMEIRFLNVKSHAAESIGRIVPIDPAIIDVVKGLVEKNVNSSSAVLIHSPEGVPLSDWMRGQFDVISQKLGCTFPINFCIIHNTFVKRLLDKGVSLSEIPKIIGLTDIARVMHYLPLDL